MKSGVILAVVLALALAASAGAQQSTPKLDELETAWATVAALQVTVLKLRQDLDGCRVEQAQDRALRTPDEVRAITADIAARINARHPGWAWNPETGQFARTPTEGSNGKR